jgi:hypothetical protein
MASSKDPAILRIARGFLCLLGAEVEAHLRCGVIPNDIYTLISHGSGIGDGIKPNV